jgi:integrase
MPTTVRVQHAKVSQGSRANRELMRCGWRYATMAIAGTVTLSLRVAVFPYASALRHAWTTMQIAAGTDARTVSDQLGHATVAFLLQTYVHPSEDAAAAAADTAKRVFGEAVSG